MVVVRSGDAGHAFCRWEEDLAVGEIVAELPDSADLQTMSVCRQNGRVQGIRTIAL
jgi:hypothetical protein